MKMQELHFNELKAAIKPLLTPALIKAYESGQFLRASTVKDLQTRFNFDLLYASKFPTAILYEYLNDTHINTALKAICPKLKRRF